MRTIIVLVSVVMLSGCGMLPGMQNIDTGTIRVEKSNTAYIDPVIIPITPDLLMSKFDSDQAYRVGPADILSVTVWNYAEFNTPAQQNPASTNSASAGSPGYIIDHDGNIYFPLIGSLNVQGKTINEVRQLIAKKLNYYLRKPSVMVRVADFRSQKVYVMGEVLKPGFLPINDQALSITDALTMSGSLDPNASDPRHIYVIRGSLTHPKIYWLNAATPAALLLGEKFQLKNHDIVIVSTAAMTRWNRFLNQMLPSLQTIWYTKTITGK